MMKIPKQLKIGGHTYKIKEVENGELNDEANCGVVLREKGIILIDKKLIASEKEETLFHEILHVLNGELVETDVDWLAQGIYAVLKNNNLLR